MRRRAFSIGSARVALLGAARTALFGTAGLILLIATGCQQKGYVQIGGYAQGGSWSVKYNTAGVKVRPAAVQAGVDAILQDIDRKLSGYNKASELSRLNAGDTIRPSAMLVRMYNRCYELWEQTGGALDVAAGPLFDIWGFGFKNGSLPSDEEVAAARKISGMGRLIPRMEDALLPDGRLCATRLILRSSATVGVSDRSTVIPQLNFNAVAQGYTCDTVASYLASLGVRDMLVDIGEILCRGVNAAGKPWRIGVDRPTDGNNSPGADLDGLWESAGQQPFAPLPQPQVPTQQASANGTAAPASSNGSSMPFQGIVTSGNYRKFYISDGVKYSHTIDPRTGRPARNNLLSATIVAPTAEEADAIATYCMVIGLEEAQRFILSQPQLEGYLIYAPGPDETGGSVGKAPGQSSAGMAEWRSEGFNLR